ncbi:hypothetical protein HD806DRAFT_516457 [Xylariaceae sp. AK1471]|nr:hypothetical protein HD806DRAFT_516457 [Xylariaceae sp. AK1471]
MGVSIEATFAIISVVVALPTSLAIVWKWTKYRRRLVAQKSSSSPETHDLELCTMHRQQPLRRTNTARTSIYITFDHAPTSHTVTDCGPESPSSITSVCDRLLPQGQESIDVSP